MSEANGIDLSMTMAPVFWGLVLSMLIGGISILQAYIYFTTNHDALIFRCTAALMIVLDVVSSCLVSQAVYVYLVPHFGSLVPLETFSIGLSVDCEISAIITFVSQIFLARQLWTVYKSRKMVSIPVLIIFLAFCAFAFGSACTTMMVLHRRNIFSNRTRLFSIFFGLAKGVSAITDIIVSGALVLFLSGSKSGIKRSDSIIKTLMEYIIERGALVTVIQILLVIVFFASERLYWVPIHVNVTKLYSNVFFAILNARIGLNEKRQAFQLSSSGISFRLRTDGQEKPLPLVKPATISAFAG